MSKISEILKELHENRIEVKVNIEGLGWIGFWIAIGMIVAAGVMKGQVVLQ
jgi:hypothetical protein